MINSKVNVKINTKNVINNFFDLSLLLYLIAFYVFYQDVTAYAGVLRTIATICIIVTGAVLCVYRLRTVDIYIVTYFLFTIVGLISILWAKDDDLVLSIMPTLVRTLIVLLFLSIRVRNKEDIERIMIIYIIAVLVLDFFILQLMVDFYSWQAFFLRRFGDNFGFNSNATANLNAFSLMFLIYFIIIGKRKWLKVFLAVLLGSVIVICGSKQGVVAAFFGIIMFFYLQGRFSERIRTILIAFITLLIAWGMIMNIPILYEIIGYRFDSALYLFTSSVIDGSTANRNELSKQAFNIWLSNPILGVGLNNFQVVQTVKTGYYYAHNNYLELLADTGLIGFFIYYSNYLRISRIKLNRDEIIQVLLKATFFMIVFIDLAVVSYQDLRYQFVLYLVFIGLKLKTKQSHDS